MHAQSWRGGKGSRDGRGRRVGQRRKAARLQTRAPGSSVHVLGLLGETTTDWGVSSRNVFSHGLEARNPKSRGGQGSLLPRAPRGGSFPHLPASGVLLAIAHSLVSRSITLISTSVFTRPPPCGSVCVHIASVYEDTGPTGSSDFLGSLRKDPVCM